MLERLQKILSARGISSRRKAEEYIEAGLVKVNGKVATLGQKADPDVDTIEVDGAVVEARKDLIYYVLHKPKGVVTTNASRKEDQTIIDLLPEKLRGVVFPIGRLDKDSSGLLILTNDGVLAYRLTHPKFDHEKEYEVETETDITDGQLAKLRSGMTILGAKTKPATVKRLGKRTFSIALTEGKNRQIRRMCQKVGAPVKELRRTRITTLTDSSLEPGDMRQLSSGEVESLFQSVGLSTAP
jgi:pseudouridine synthase